MPVSSELEKDTPLGNVPYVHVMVPVYRAVWLTVKVVPADDAMTYGDALVSTGTFPYPVYTTMRLVRPKSPRADTVKLRWNGTAYCATANVIWVSSFGIVSVMPTGSVVYDHSMTPVSAGEAV